MRLVTPVVECRVKFRPSNTEPVLAVTRLAARGYTGHRVYQVCIKFVKFQPGRSQGLLYKYLFH